MKQKNYWLKHLKKVIMLKKCAEIFGKQKHGLSTDTAKRNTGSVELQTAKRGRKPVLSNEDTQNIDSAKSDY
ncbi:MAG: hypothetical protein LUH47_10595 [Clostridiales bacterium]|nr:hypothetical protein [Clostridiales bacterium]